MIYNEINSDLFSVPDNYYFVQCISADFVMGRGISACFNIKFNVKYNLCKKYGDVIYQWNHTSDNDRGFCIKQGRVFNLVTKCKYFDKPTYKTMRNSLNQLKILTERNNIKYLAMPTIGCGLDKLKWDKVSDIIKDIFKDSDINILVCYI